MQVRTYDAQDGSKRWVTEVVADEVEFLDSRQDAQAGGNAPEQGYPTKAPEIPDEEIPF